MLNKSLKDIPEEQLDALIDAIQDRLMADGESYTIEVKEIQKLAKKKIALELIPQEVTDDRRIVPNIYLDSFLSDEDFARMEEPGFAMFCASKIVDTWEMEKNIDPEFKAGMKELADNVMDWNYAKENVVAMMCSSEKAGEYLNGITHATIGDMAVYFRIAKETEEQSYGVTITDELLKRYNIDKKTLYDTAIANTQKKYPAEFCDITALLKEFSDVTLEPVQVFPENEAPPITVMTNSRRLNGAVTMLFPQTQEMLFEKFPDGFLLLPSSIHEILIVPREILERDGVEVFCDMVRSVNETQVLPDEFLSDIPIYGDPRTKKLYQVNDMDRSLEIQLGRDKKIERSR